MTGWALAWRLARRELRGGTRGFRVLIACLALGVFAIAGAGSVGEAARTALRDNGRELLGGDLEARLVYRSLSDLERAALVAHGKLSVLSEMRSMVSRGEATSLSEIKAVDNTYPLVGTLVTAPRIPLSTALESQADGSYGAVLAPALAERLGVVVGDTVTLGQVRLKIVALIVSEPDAAATPMIFGPRLFISPAALTASGLLLPGSLVTQVVHLAITDGSTAEGLSMALNKQFPDTGWQLRTAADAAPALKNILDVIGQFLTFIGLTALLIGGVGVANAIAAFVEARAASIATLKCLGAPSGLVYRIYGLQIAVLAGVGVVIGLIAGALVPVSLGWLAARLGVPLPVAVPPGPFPVVLLMAGVFGAMTALAFALGPLQRVKHLPAAMLYPSAVGIVPDGKITLSEGVAMAALAGLAIVAVPHHLIAAWFVGGTIVTLGLFRLVTSALQRSARWARRFQVGSLLRLALANLYRPGNPARSIILSLGVGTTVLVSVALTEATLSGAIGDRLPKIAPAFFFVDIQPKQQADFTQLIENIPDGHVIQLADMVRGRLTALKGQKITPDNVDSDAQWAVRGDRGFTTATTLPEHTELVAGTWWPADYHGPALVSITADLAKGLHVTVGDSVTFNILGREVVTTIASIRRVDWSSMSMNFAFLLSPGVLEHAPRTFIATVGVPIGSEEATQRAVIQKLPNATAINVREALAQVSGLLAAGGHAVEASASITLTAGILVLVASIAAGQRRRVSEAVVLQILGVRRRQIMTMQVIEFALLGASAGVIAALVGTLSAWALTVYVFRLSWQFQPLPVVETVLSAALLAGFAGAVATWQALAVKPARRLREEDMASG